MLQHAFKEWAAVCRVLADGRQSIILRKGGVAEDGGMFKPEHVRFWLYPTFVHQQANGVKPEATDLLAAAERDRPPAGTVRLTHFVELDGAYHVHQLVGVLLLDDMHVWTEATVRQRFDYRTPGLFVLLGRVYRAAAAHDIVETPQYAGCKSWVELDRPLPTDGAVPVISDEAFADVRRKLNRLLTPTATV